LNLFLISSFTLIFLISYSSSNNFSTLFIIFSADWIAKMIVTMCEKISKTLIAFNAKKTKFDSSNEKWNFIVEKDKIVIVTRKDPKTGSNCSVIKLLDFFIHLNNFSYPPMIISKPAKFENLICRSNFAFKVSKRTWIDEM
jgi:hypothetical protein